MKRGRGPKPKYVFGSREEAAGARRERNRKAALDSYYRCGHGYVTMGAVLQLRLTRPGLHC